MKNPFAKFSKDSDFRVKRDLKRETEENQKDLDVFEKIQEDDEFARFLVEINPAYASMDLEKKANQQIVKEKYQLYLDQKELNGEVRTLYTQEIFEELGIKEEFEAANPTDAEKDFVFHEMGRAMRELAQKDSVQFQRMKNKLKEYNKLKEEMEELTSKFEEAVSKKIDREGIKAMGDRQGMLEQAEGKVFWSKEGARAYFGRMWGNRDMAHSIADLTKTFELDQKELSDIMSKSGTDLKEAQKAFEKMQELREYFVKTVDFSKDLIDAAKDVAIKKLRGDVEDIAMGETAPETYTLAEKKHFLAEIQNIKQRQNAGGSLLPDELKLLAMENTLLELEELDTLESEAVAAGGTDKLDAGKTARLRELSKNQKTRLQKRLKGLESVRKLSVKMREGKGKKGGIDFTAGVKAMDLKTGADVDVDKAFINMVEQGILTEVKNLFEKAALHGKNIKEFLEVAEPYLSQWTLGGHDSRDKVRKFMVKTLKDICQMPPTKVNPVIKVQLKAYLAQRGMNPVTFKLP